MRIESMTLSDLLSRQHLKNPKEHDIEELIASFLRFGFTAPPTIDEKTEVLVAGHGRALALRLMVERNMPPPKRIEISPAGDWLVPVIRDVSFETEKERDAYVIADNAHVMNGGWNLDKLLELLNEQDAFEGLGFDDATMKSFGVGAKTAIEDAFEEADEDSNASSLSTTAGGSSGIEAKVFEHDALLEATFAHYRKAGFPYPNPSPQECMEEINRLASMPLDGLVRSTVAYGVADKFQPHRFAASAEKKLSPLTSFNDDEQLRRAIELSLKYDGSLSDGAIRGVISLVRNTQACANFRPGFAAYLYRRFCPPGGVALDTSTGYGGRLVGALASTIVSHYIGIDPNPPTVAGNKALLAMLGRESFATLLQSPAEDVDHSLVKGRCDFAFTSPPYFRKEHYSDDDTQSWKRYPEADAWRDKFLTPMIALTFAALKPGSLAAINIGDVLLDNVRHPLGEWATTAAKRAGFELAMTLNFPMTRRFGSNQKDEVATEPVFVFRKPS